MVASEDRRAGATRTPFEGTVEVGGTLGPSFEAQAVNVSEEGMQLRTAYLPELGQQVTCRFETGTGQTVIGSGDVMWSHGGEAGGEFGIRFTDIDPDSIEPLKRICGVAAPAALGQPGSKVRLYIDGLASPMRAKVRDSQAAAITVGSDLGFLQVGKHLELEDAQSGAKRPASIHRVDVAVDASSQIPQLVVTLRYTDVPADAGVDPLNRPEARPTFPSGEVAAMDAQAQMKSALARNAARVGPALKRLAQRAKVAAMLLVARRTTDEDSTPRRTTAPPPAGGLHSLGRRVVRGEAGASTSDDSHPTQPKRAGAKRRAAVVGVVLVTALTGAMALKHFHHESEPVASPAPATATAVATVAAASAAPVVAPNIAATVSALAVAQAAASLPATGAEDSDESSHAANHKKLARPTPFANGPVHHGNMLRLKMDGPIEAIEGAQQPTGFVVKIPGHKSLEAAGPLAARDSRIAAIKVTNDAGGAELSVTFKDGVPNYQVSARGDSLVIALAAPGALEATTTAKRDDTTAKRDDKAARNPKHGTRERDTTPER